MPTILCIDDEPSSLAVRRLLLEAEGYSVIHALTGAEGLRLFRSTEVNLVILDYWMSDVKGMTVAGEMKQVRPGIPIIMLSGFGELPGEAVGVVNRWILKGRSPHELLEAIKNLI